MKVEFVDHRSDILCYIKDNTSPRYSWCKCFLIRHIYFIMYWPSLSFAVQ